MNEEQIKQLIKATYEARKLQYDEEKTALDSMDKGDNNWQLQNYMTGYAKGQASLMELLNSAIQ